LVTVDRFTGRPTVRFTRPLLPPFLRSVRIRDLRVGDEEVDLELHRHGSDVGVQMLRRSPLVDVIITA
jgi:hypothetical protein